MPELVTQLTHRTLGKLEEIDVGSKACEQAALRSNGVSGIDRVLHQIASLDQREQVPMNRSLGQVEALGELRDAKLLAGKGNRLQHIEGDLNRANADIGTILGHFPASWTYVCYRGTSYHTSSG